MQRIRGLIEKFPESPFGDFFFFCKIVLCRWAGHTFVWKDHKCQIDISRSLAFTSIKVELRWTFFMMDNNEIQAVIKRFYLERKAATKIKSRLNGVLGDSSPLFYTLRFWVSEFMRGCTDTSDEPRSGRTKTTTRPEILDKSMTWLWKTAE